MGGGESNPLEPPGLCEVREVTVAERYLNEEASVRVNILGAIRCGEGDDDSARRRHVEKLPSGLTAE